MRQKLLIIMLFAAVLTPWFGANAEVAVEWLDGVHDFGAFDEDDGKVTCDFRFVNTGNEPVSVVSARASCGCTVPAFPRHAINPGDTAAITVTFNPTGRPGKFDKNVKVQMSGGHPLSVTLHIKGVVIGNSNTLRSRYPVDAGVMKLRKKVIAFGEVTRPNAKSDFFEIYNASPDSITPEWSMIPPYLKVSVVNPTIPPGEQIAYALVLRPDATDTYGILLDSIALKASPDADPIMLDIVANITEDFSRLSDKQLADAPTIKLSDTTVDFGHIDAATTNLTRTLTITNAGKNEMKIRRVYTADPGVTVSVDRSSLKRGKSATVTVTVDPTQLPSEILNARIAIITNDPYNSQTIVRAVGQINE